MVRPIFRTGLRVTDMVTASDSMPADTGLTTHGIDDTLNWKRQIHLISPEVSRALGILNLITLYTKHHRVSHKISLFSRPTGVLWEN